MDARVTVLIHSSYVLISSNCESQILVHYECLQNSSQAYFLKDLGVLCYASFFGSTACLTYSFLLYFFLRFLNCSTCRHTIRSAHRMQGFQLLWVASIHLFLFSKILKQYLSRYALINALINLHKNNLNAIICMIALTFLLCCLSLMHMFNKPFQISILGVRG